MSRHITFSIIGAQPHILWSIFHWQTKPFLRTCGGQSFKIRLRRIWILCGQKSKKGWEIFWDKWISSEWCYEGIEGRLDEEVKLRREIEYFRRKMITEFWKFDPISSLSLPRKPSWKSYSSLRRSACCICSDAATRLRSSFEMETSSSKHRSQNRVPQFRRRPTHNTAIWESCFSGTGVPTSMKLSTRFNILR